jgi:hypothetical protein
LYTQGKNSNILRENNTAHITQNGKQDIKEQKKKDKWIEA